MPFEKTKWYFIQIEQYEFYANRKDPKLYVDILSNFKNNHLLHFLLYIFIWIAYDRV